MPPSQSHFDKAEFQRLCRAHDLPSVPVLAVFEDGLITEQHQIGGEALFSKPADLTEGKGSFARWDPLAQRTADEQIYRSNDGRELTLASIFEVLRVQSREGPYLLQPSLSNHEAIGRFVGLDALCTLRIPTCRHPDGKIDLLPLANFKVALDPGEVRDNTAAGGMFYGVDVTSGRLTFGAKRGTSEVFVRHPRTDEVAQDFVLPCWDEAVALCKTAHTRLGSTYPTLGWDVAITPQGPVLVEMNVRWIRPTGVPGEAFTGETAYVDCVLAHFGRLWPEQMPRRL
jgi:hypothetical protein